MTNDQIDAIKQRFMRKVDIQHATTGCWHWLGWLDKRGYGRFAMKAPTKNRCRMHVAHRIAWTLFVDEIPEGMLVCHKCDNPKCVNPAHLFIGSSLDNERDKIAKGRDRKALGESNPKAKLKANDIAEIIRLHKEQREQLKSIARRYGVSDSNISSIVKRKTWKTAV